MKEVLNGFKVEGSWKEVINLSERVTDAFRESDLDETEGDNFEEWEEWRPEYTDSVENDINERTADANKTERSESDKNGKTPREDVKDAGKELKEIDKLSSAPEQTKESTKYLGRGMISSVRRFVRSIEEFIYMHVMTKFSPYYFDNELVSANITKKGNNHYVFEVRINKDDLADTVLERIKSSDVDMDDSVREDIETETVEHSEESS